MGVTKAFILVSFRQMVREISAGGVIVRPTAEGWQTAVIEPQHEAVPNDSQRGRKRWQKMLLALPKGLLDPGEEPYQTALREVFEETGLKATLITKLGDIKYVYVRSWGNREQVFKIVSFYLLRYHSGTIDEISPDMRVEVKRALWIALEEAVEQLAYRGEKDMVRQAQEYLKVHPELASGKPLPFVPP
ncbi:MAG TPA: NUDIX domain-containing protein [Terriglobales bacterium]|nr:NUDIX domain-containing protein [Terriglobales bacterium]